MNAQLQPAPHPGLSAYAPGIYPDVPAEVYHRRELGVVNNGALKILSGQTPAHYRAWVDDTAEHAETPALSFGRAFHSLALEPSKFHREFALQPVFGDLRTKAAKESRDAWLADHPGVTPISADDWMRMQAMAKAVREHPIAGQFFIGGMPEATCVWTCPRTGLICKSRMDYWREDIWMIGDLKSTDDASPRAFARSVVNYGYHLQDAHYTEGPRVIFGNDAPKFLFVAVEKAPPYAVGVYMLDADAEARGHELRDRAMDTLDACLRTDEWPGLPPVVNTLSLPGWAFTD